MPASPAAIPATCVPWNEARRSTASLPLASGSRARRTRGRRSPSASSISCRPSGSPAGRRSRPARRTGSSGRRRRRRSPILTPVTVAAPGRAQDLRRRSAQGSRSSAGRSGSSGRPARRRELHEPRAAPSAGTRAAKPLSRIRKCRADRGGGHDRLAAARTAARCGGCEAAQVRARRAASARRAGRARSGPRATGATLRERRLPQRDDHGHAAAFAGGGRSKRSGADERRLALAARASNRLERCGGGGGATRARPRGPRGRRRRSRLRSVAEADGSRLAAVAGRFEGKKAARSRCGESSARSRGRSRGGSPRRGAQLAFTYQGERIEKGVRELAETVGSPLVTECDVRSDEDVAARLRRGRRDVRRRPRPARALGRLRGRGGPRGPLHGHAARPLLAGLDVSAYSLVACARAAEPLMEARRRRLDPDDDVPRRRARGAALQRDGRGQGRARLVA